MQIGIISDVHGDLHALETTLHKLKHIHRVSHILCAGDLIGRGPEQNRVVDVLRQTDIIAVRGNHDEYFSGVSKENASYLKGLPLDWQGTFGGIRLFMCHGKPGNNMWGMYRDHLSSTYLNMVLTSLKADILITGHTHMPLFMRVKNGCLLNAGSLYTFASTRNSSQTYGVLSLPDITFTVYDACAPDVLPLELTV